MTDEYDPDRPGPPREVHEDAAARERSMTAEETASQIVMPLIKLLAERNRGTRDMSIMEQDTSAINRAANAIADALHSHAEQARAEERAAKDFAYNERNQLVALLARLFPSGVAKTDIPGWDEEWHGCVYIDLPTGQASWHYHDSEAHLFDGLPPYEGVWDGHTTKEKYRRLIKLIEPDIRQRSEAPDD